MPQSPQNIWPSGFSLSAPSSPAIPNSVPTSVPNSAPQIPNTALERLVRNPHSLPAVPPPVAASLSGSRHEERIKQEMEDARQLRRLKMEKTRLDRVLQHSHNTIGTLNPAFRQLPGISIDDSVVQLASQPGSHSFVSYNSNSAIPLIRRRRSSSAAAPRRSRAASVSGPGSEIFRQSIGNIRNSSSDAYAIDENDQDSDENDNEVVKLLGRNISPKLKYPSWFSTRKSQPLLSPSSLKFLKPSKHSEAACNDGNDGNTSDLLLPRPQDLQIAIPNNWDGKWVPKPPGTRGRSYSASDMDFLPGLNSISRRLHQRYEAYRQPYLAQYKSHHHRVKQGIGAPTWSWNPSFLRRSSAGAAGGGGGGEIQDKQEFWRAEREMYMRDWRRERAFLGQIDRRKKKSFS